MSEFRAYPRLEAFERLHISDGLAINAERWQQAHRYHRQRQNFQYQALYEPGIVYGLGVATLPGQGDGRLLQVQPGIAIDVEGNPIVVKQPEEFRIVSEPTEGQSLLVHLAVNYVDPDTLRGIPATQVVRESFRIVEKLHLEPGDVEICRILLLPGTTQIQPPTDVFSPGTNQLDFRGRCHPKPYPQFRVQVGQITSDRPSDSITLNGWVDLLRSLDGLYPLLHGNPTIQTLPAQSLARESVTGSQLLYIPYSILLRLMSPVLQRLQLYLAQGGVLLVVADFAEVNLLELLNIGRELRAGLAEAERDRDLFEQTGAQLQAEIIANQNAVSQRLAEIEQPLGAIAPRLGLSFTGNGELDDDHPLRWQPFIFSQLPTCQGHPIYVKNWDGLVLMVGDLSHCWGRKAVPEQPRELLRSAQEWGINLLHFAAQRHQWVQAMQPLPAVSEVPPTDNLRQRVQFSV